MIAPQTLFGLSMERRHDRRLFVLGYATFLALFIVLGVVWNEGFLFGGMLQSVLLAGVLGGIRPGGPVKRFSGKETAGDDLTVTTASFPVQTLNLDHRLPDAGKKIALDERETGERDRAHYTAFRLLRWIAMPVCTLLALALHDLPRVAERYGPAVLWALLMLILSLPQTVILWTEPDDPA